MATIFEQSSSPGYHVFHQQLDVYWVVLETLHVILSKFPDLRPGLSLHDLEEGDTADLLTQTVNLLTWDLTQLALTRFSKV